MDLALWTFLGDVGPLPGCASVCKRRRVQNSSSECPFSEPLHCLVVKLVVREQPNHCTRVAAI